MCAIGMCANGGAIHLDTVQMPTATHSDQCLEAFHCLSVVSGWRAIEPCPFERHSANGTFPLQNTVLREN